MIIMDNGPVILPMLSILLNKAIGSFISNMNIIIPMITAIMEDLIGFFKFIKLIKLTLIKHNSIGPYQYDEEHIKD